MFKKEVWLQHVIPTDCPGLRIPIFWSESEVADSDPIFTARKVNLKNIRDGDLGEGIHVWDEFVVTLPNLADLGFKNLAVDLHGKRKRTQNCYEIYWRLTMVHDAGNAHLCWELARPGTQPYDAKGKERRAAVEMVGYQLCEITNTSHHPFVRTAV